MSAPVVVVRTFPQYCSHGELGATSRPVAGPTRATAVTRASDGHILGRVDEDDRVCGGRRKQSQEEDPISRRTVLLEASESLKHSDGKRVWGRKRV